MGTGSRRDAQQLGLWTIDDRPSRPRPTRLWSRRVADDAAAVAAGTLSDAEAYAAQLWPPDFIAAVNTVLEAYERDVRNESPTDDEAIWSAVERAVRALNVVNAEYSRIETGEREELAGYLRRVLSAAGVDVAGLAAGRRLHPHELTDTWRSW